MAPDREDGALAADLTALGRALAQPVPSERLAVVVMARLSDAPPPPVANPLRQLVRRAAAAVARHRRRVMVLVTAIVLAALAAPPVRAAVSEWFGFAGVSVHVDPSVSPSVAPPAPPLDSTISLDEARKLVAFEPVVPRLLGLPSGVDVSRDRKLLSMSWTDRGAGAVRLDQFDGRLDYTFAKTAPDVQYTSVAGAFAIWFDAPHEVVVLNADGTRRTETARLAGHTLIWEYRGSTLRLEGDMTLARAVEIAGSVSSVP